MNKIIMSMIVLLIPFNIQAQEKEVLLKDYEPKSSHLEKAYHLVVSKLNETGYQASEFYVKVTSAENDYNFSLKHISENELQNEANKKGYRITGNPSGKSQICKYNSESNNVSCLHYQ